MTFAERLALFLLFVRLNPSIAETDPVVRRAFSAYMAVNL